MSVLIDETTFLATIAATLNGGRFAHLAKDADVKASAMALVAPARDARRKLATSQRVASMRARKAKDAAQRAEWFASFNGYAVAADCGLPRAERCGTCSVDMVFAAYSQSPKRSHVRLIARALLAPERFARGKAYQGWDAKDVESERRMMLADWRVVIRQYRDARAEVARVGTFAISRFDASPTIDSRFYRNVLQHWHNYAGGKHIALGGVTPDDAFQDGILSAIESGDTLDGVPTFGNMYMHVRQAVEAAVYTYRRYGSNSAHAESFTTWTWADWSEWAKANDGIDRLAYSTIPEWSAYHTAKSAHDAEVRHADMLKGERERHAVTLDESRKAFHALIESGMTVQRIANTLGRTVEAILADIESGNAGTEVVWINATPTIPAVIDREPLEVTRRMSMGDVARLALSKASA